MLLYNGHLRETPSRALHLYDIAIFTENSLSCIVTDRRRRRNHYGTSHQARNIETTKDSSPRNLRARLNIAYKIGDMYRRGDSYVENKYLAARKLVRLPHTWDALLRSSAKTRTRPRENETRNNTYVY